MDLYTFASALWPCVQSTVAAHYPEAVSGLLQIVGGASVLYAAVGKKGEAAGAGSWLNKATGLLSTIALNRK